MSDAAPDWTRDYASADEDDEATLTVTLHRDDGAVRLVASGELDIYTVPQMQQALAAAWEPTPESLVLDFRPLDFVDSAGLALLIDVYRRVGEGGSLTLLAPGEGQVREVLKLSRFDQFFRIEFSEP